MSRAVRLNREEYRTEFLSSPEWLELRELVMSTKPKCSICENRAKDLHHLIYRKNVYDTKITDLIPLCRGCHTMVHDAIKARLIMSPSSDLNMLTKIKSQTLRLTAERLSNHRSWKLRRRELGVELFNRIMLSGAPNAIGRSRGILKCTQENFRASLVTTNNRADKINRMLNYDDMIKSRRMRRKAASKSICEERLSKSQKARRKKQQLKRDRLSKRLGK